MAPVYIAMLWLIFMNVTMDKELFTVLFVELELNRAIISLLLYNVYVKS